MCSTLDLCKCPGELRREGEEIALCLVKEYWVGFQIDDLPQNAVSHHIFVDLKMCGLIFLISEMLYLHF